MSSISTVPSYRSLVDRWAANSHDFVALVGRLAMGWIFVSSGFGKITNVADFSAVLAKNGVPAPSVLGWIGSIVEFVGGLFIIFGLELRSAAVVMSLFVIVATLISHRYWESTGGLYMPQRLNFWKNVAIFGGFLFMFLAGPGRYSVDGARSNT